MPVPTRPTKASSGTTTYVAGTVIGASEIDADFVELYNGFTNLDETNFSGSASFDPAKIDDYSVSAAEQKTVADPGSGASLTPATDLTGEIASLRYAIERIALGLVSTTHAQRKPATAITDVSWADYPVRPGNMALNGSFEVKTSTTAGDAPDQWSLVGTPTSVDVSTTDASEGAGLMATITCTAGGAEGIKQTFTKLKASTRYMISVRAKVTSGTTPTARMVTTGGMTSGDFQNLTLDTTSSSFATLSGVVATDATPTALVVSLLGVGADNVVHFDHFSIQECSRDIVSLPKSYSVVSASTDEVALPDGVGTDSGLSCVVIPPTPGYQIAVRAKINLFASGGGATKVAVQLKENGTEKDISYWSAPQNHSGTAVVEYMNLSPTPGDTYTYTVVITPTTYAQKMNNSGLGNQRSVLTVNVRR